MTNIFDDDQNCAEKIVECGQIDIEKDDGFPQTICNGCIQLLENAYTFKTLCTQSDETLKSELVKNEVIKGEFESHEEPAIDTTGFSECMISKMEVSNSENIDTFNNTVDSDENDSVVMDDNLQDSDWTEEKRDEKDDLEVKSESIEAEKKQEKPDAKRKRKRNHAFVRNYQCDQCGYMTRGPTALEDHIKFHHQGISRYKCPQCSSMFRTRALMRVHVETVHVIGPSVCDICGETCKNKLSLINHKRRCHFAQKKFKCEYCDYRACKMSLVRKHQTLHTDERNFVCTFCEKKFRLQSTLNCHVKGVHYGERNFKV